MLQYFETLADISGNALLGATVQVLNFPALTQALIYATNGTATPIANATVTADITGQISFFVPDGSYQLVYTYNGTVFKTKPAVQMLDPMGYVTATDTGAADAYVVNSTAYPVSLYIGQKISFKASHANTGAAATLNVNGTGTQPLVQTGGALLSLGMIPLNGIIHAEWDGVQWQVLGTQSQPFYATIQAELTAGVTIANGFYPVGNADRYALNVVPGTTDMAGGFNSAFKVMLLIGGEVTYGQTAPYLTSSPINATVAGSPNQKGIIVRNLGPSGTDAAVANLGIVAKHNGVAIFDCTGNDNIEFRNCALGTDRVTFPQIGILWARNSAGGSLFNRMYNCRIIGSFSIAPFYNYGSEDDVLIDTYFWNTSTAAGTKTRVYTAGNIFGVTSPFVTIFAGVVSNIDHNAYGCLDQNQAGTATSDCVYLDQADSFKNDGGWMYNGSASANGRALIFVDMSVGPSNFGKITGLTGEQATFMQQYGVLFSNHVQTPTGWTIDGNRLPNQNFAIAALGTNPILDNFNIRNNTDQSNHGLSFPGFVQNSSLVMGATLLTIGTSKNNVISGYSENWTINTRSNDFWIDQGITNRTWTPALGSGWTNTGGINFTNKICQLMGNQCTVHATLFAGATLAAAAGATITGLPKAATGRSALVVVTNSDTGASLGQGSIAGSTITLSGFTNVGTADVTVSATYSVG